MTAHHMRSYINLLENTMDPASITNNLGRQIAAKIGEELEHVRHDSGTAHSYARNFYTQNQKANKSQFFKGATASTHNNNIFYHVVNTTHKVTSGLYSDTVEFQVCVVNDQAAKVVNEIYKKFCAPFKHTQPECYVTQPHVINYGNMINNKPVPYLVWSMTLPWPNIESTMQLAEKLGLGL